MTDYDRLILEIWTDGGVQPEDALASAARILIRHFNIFVKGEDEEDLAASHVLTAVGVPAEFCSGSLTVSMGKDNTAEEVDYMISVMPGIVERLLAMSPLYSDKLKGKDPYSS